MDSTSILTTVKKMMGIPEDVEDFDPDVIVLINTVFSEVNQMGIGPTKCYKISSKDDKWEDFDKRLDMEMFKTYIFMKTRMLFDPPANTQLTESYKATITELEYRIHTLWDQWMNSDDEDIKAWADGNANT